MLRPATIASLFLAISGVTGAVRAQTDAVSPQASTNTAPVAPPSAEAQAEAARRFEHAVKLYGDAEYALALAEFERVYELVPDYRVLYNIGQVNMQVGRYARALRTLEEYLKRGGDQVPVERAQQVKMDLDSLAARVARIDVRVDQPGADVLVDGVSLGVTPIAEPLVVDVGDRRLQVRLGGYRTWEQTLRLAGGDRRDLTLVLEREVLQQSPQVPAPKTDAMPTAGAAQPATVKAGPNLRWIGWTTAGVLGASAVVTGIAAVGAANNLAREQESSSTTRDKLDAAEGRARALLLATDLLAAGAIATASVTLYFELKAPSKREPVRPPAARVAIGLRSMTVTVAY
jgi:hypothetical protein